MAEPENEVVARLAAAAGQLRPVDAGTDVYSVLVPDGYEHVLVDTERWLPAPRRKTGSVILHTGDSFSAYVNAHKGPETALYADPRSTPAHIVAVLNGHGSGPGFGDHRATLALRHSPAWQRWVGRDNDRGSQTTFAEHLEVGAGEIVDPPAATMLELAETFHANTKVTFTSSHVLSSDQRALEYREQTEASAGRTGSITVPKSFTLALAVFEGDVRREILARLRFSTSGGQLKIGYSLDRPDELAEEAFDAIVAGVEEATTITAYRGRPVG